MIKVYSKPNCMQCEFTKKFLKENGLQFEVRDVFESEKFKEEIVELGFTSLPVVVADGHEPFAGFRPDVLETLLP
jgi:glutaredoxin-like protein nrdH